MGFSHSWVAIQGLEPEQAIAALEMEVSQVQKPEDIDWRRIVAMGQFPGKWLVVISSDAEDAFKGRLKRLLALGPAIACQVYESVMFSEARGYASGEEIWRVVHDPETGEAIGSLEVSGNPPPQFEAIARQARAEQDAEGGEEAGVDFIFDVPGRLSLSICGYMPGEPEPEDLSYSLLRPIGGTEEGSSGRSFFARLFGRG